MTDNSQQSRDLSSKESVAPLMLWGVRHRANCWCLNTPAGEAARRPCNCGALLREIELLRAALTRIGELSLSFKPLVERVLRGEPFPGELDLDTQPPETPERIPASERQPIPVTEIIDALQREGWVAAADGLKEVKDWETRTLMCRIDSRPSEVVGAVNGPDRTP